MTANLTPYRMIFSGTHEPVPSEHHVIQFHPSADIAASRALDLRDRHYHCDDVFVFMESGFYPQPMGLREFLHAKEIA